MNRRSFLAALGLSPVVAVVASASQAEPHAAVSTLKINLDDIRPLAEKSIHEAFGTLPARIHEIMSDPRAR